MKSYTIDDRYWADSFKTPCLRCQNMTNYCDHICSAFPEELPPEYWNGEKSCPRREVKKD